MKILPSILAADYLRLGEQVADAERGGADRFHIDVMDGLFVPNLSLGIPVVEAMRRAGPNPTRMSFRQALESLRGLDLGIGASLTFSPERHQGLDSVYFTRVDGERWVPISDWTTAVQA